MAKVTMSLYEALERKKNYEDRFKKISLRNTPMIGRYTEMKKQINGVDLETAEKILKSNFDTFIHLQKNIISLQVAINQANLSHTISIDGYKNGEPITLVEAITANQKMESRINQVNTIANMIQNELIAIESDNKKYLDSDYVYSQVSKQGSNDKKSENSAEILAANIKAYKENNTVKLFDPNRFVETDWVNKQLDEINSFKTNLHTALMQANTTIMIDVELED